ncbi:MAG: hypothetical protein NG747_14455 [Candidatus Brocadia sp.]|nr:hypothetical protein [Candidatus Brocadia sp.]
MEVTNEIEQEEISLVENSSSKAMNGELLIFCASITTHTAKVSVLMLGRRGEIKSKEPEVGNAIEYEGSMDTFYKVTLLAKYRHPKLYTHKIDVLVSKYKL